MRWAVECAKLAKRYSCIKGLIIDDFDGNENTFTPQYCRDMMRAAHDIEPHLALLLVNYFGYYEKTMAEHVPCRSHRWSDFPYFYPQKNHLDSSLLLPQTREFRRWLDQQTQLGGFSKRCL